MVTKAELLVSVIRRYDPTDTPDALLNVRLVEPAVAPPVIETPGKFGCADPSWITPFPLPNDFNTV